MPSHLTSWAQPSPAGGASALVAFIGRRSRGEHGRHWPRPAVCTLPAMTASTLPLAGTGALVTGGGSGIGLGAARRLLADGATVTLMGRTPEDASTAAADLRGRRARRRRGAHLRGRHGAPRPTSPAPWRPPRPATACTGRCCRPAPAPWGRSSRTPPRGVGPGDGHQPHRRLPRHQARRRRPSPPRAVAPSSPSRRSPAPLTHPYMAPYCVSKAGLEALVRNAADELGRGGVRVNAVRPGLVRTELADPLLERRGGRRRLPRPDADLQGRHGRRHRRGRSLTSAGPGRRGSPARCSASTAATRCAAAPTSSTGRARPLRRRHRRPDLTGVHTESFPRRARAS